MRHCLALLLSRDAQVETTQAWIAVPYMRGELNCIRREVVNRNSGASKLTTWPWAGAPSHFGTDLWRLDPVPPILTGSIDPRTHARHPSGQWKDCYSHGFFISLAANAHGSHRQRL